MMEIQGDRVIREERRPRPQVRTEKAGQYQGAGKNKNSPHQLTPRIQLQVAREGGRISLRRTNLYLYIIREGQTTSKPERFRQTFPWAQLP